MRRQRRTNASCARQSTLSSALGPVRPSSRPQMRCWPGRTLTTNWQRRPTSSGPPQHPPNRITQYSWARPRPATEDTHNLTLQNADENGEVANGIVARFITKNMPTANWKRTWRAELLLAMPRRHENNCHPPVATQAFSRAKSNNARTCP